MNSLNTVNKLLNMDRSATVLLMVFCTFGLLTRNSSQQNTERSLIGENHLIINNSGYQASSYYKDHTHYTRYKPYNGKLLSSYGWAPRDNDNPDDYLQIDLGTPRAITAVATQGDSYYEEWVTSYKLNVSIDGLQWTGYKGDSREIKIFNGSTNHDGIVRNNFSCSIIARYTRFIPVEFYGYKTMRVNVYVTDKGPSAPRNVSAILIPARGLVRPQVVITWNGPCDLNGIIRKYTIVYYYNMDTSNRKIVTISGTSDLSYTIDITGSKILSYKISATTNKEGPYAAGGNITIPDYKCPERSLVGENKLDIPNSSYTASSHYRRIPHDARFEPHNAQLYGSHGWAPRDNDNPRDYLQIDLGIPRVVVAVATQGSGDLDEWVEMYKLKFSIDGLKWSEYKEKYMGIKVFNGNKDRGTVVRQELKNPTAARYIRFVPVYFYRCKTMRVNVYVACQDIEPPRIASVVPRKRSIELSWTIKPCSLVVRYAVRIEENKTGTYEVASSGTVCNVINLKPYTEYNVSVGAIQQVGYGIWTNTTTTTTAIAEPEAFPVLNAEIPASPDAIELKWKLKNPEMVHGPLKGYRITYTPQGGNTKTIDLTSNVTTYNLTSLLKYTTYSISVAVMNTKYIGPASTRRSVRTLQDAPSAPVSVNGKLLPAQGSVGPRVVITWYRPRDLNGIIRKYTILYYYNMDTSSKKIVTISGTSDLSYTMNVTENRTLSYKISATTIKEGPYAVGNDLFIPKHHIKSKQRGADAAAKKSSALFSRWMIAGLVGGFIVILFIQIIVIALYKRRHQDHNIKGEVVDPVPRSSSIPLATIDEIPCNEYTDHRNLDMSENMPLEIDKAENEIKDESEVSAPDEVSVQSSLIEFAPAPDKSKLAQEFKSIPVEPSHRSKVAKKSANQIKNRYKNIIPYDHSLVTLKKVNGDPSSCYINASFIRGYDGTPATYIATQGPLNNTLNDFWRMIWDQKVSSILMLTNLLELGKRKCHQYWPENSAQYSDITVTNQKTEVFADFVIRTFFLSKAGMPDRRVRQFHFTAWPDKGVPDHATAVLAFRRKALSMSSDDTNPTVIHCSAGVGRTGTYIMIDAMLRQAEHQRDVDIIGYFKAIRDDRPHMVQTLEQYIFVNMAVHEALTCGNTELQVHNLGIVMQQLSAVDKCHKRSGYAMEFQRLEAVTSQVTQDSFAVGLAKGNIKKNRYSKIFAANESRVILSTDKDANKADYVNASAFDTDHDVKGDYINASFVDTYRDRNAFIMTQAPMENTIVDFWRMVMDYEIGTIVMLNNLQEECESFPEYWPTDGTKKYGDVTVRLLETKDLGDVISRQFKVNKEETRHTVYHLQNLTWENKCIPADPQTVLNLLHEIQKCQRKSTGKSPIVVQCSNGVGRSGTFCAIASCLERVKQEQVLDVFQTVKSIRVNRPGAVETLTQYVFCYIIIQKYLDTFGDYANFDNKD